MLINWPPSEASSRIMTFMQITKQDYGLMYLHGTHCFFLA